MLLLSGEDYNQNATPIGSHNPVFQVIDLELARHTRISVRVNENCLQNSEKVFIL